MNNDGVTVELLTKYFDGITKQTRGWVSADKITIKPGEHKELRTNMPGLGTGIVPGQTFDVVGVYNGATVSDSSGLLNVRLTSNGVSNIEFPCGTNYNGCSLVGSRTCKLIVY